MVSWEPILVGDLGNTAAAAIRAIADDIDTAPVRRAAPADRALFWAYAAGYFDDDASSRALDASVAAVVAAVDEGTIGGPALYSGLAGAGWVLAHVTDGVEVLEQFDEILLPTVSKPGPWIADYDLVGGLTGLAVYFLERANERGADGLGHIVRHFATLARPSSIGATWFTPANLLPPWQAEVAPNGYYNCGVAHGVPGVVAVLARIATSANAAPATRETARGLCREALAWVASQELAPNPLGHYPSWSTPPDVPAPARTAWCYGDPGIANALWTACSVLGDPVDRWRELALDVARRPIERCGIRDPGLCHGAAGLGHLLNRAYQATGDATLRVAAIRWFERALAMRGGEGIGGFTMFHQVPGQPGETITSQELLEGSAGVGLALLAGLASEPPGWDRLLLCDIPT